MAPMLVPTTMSGTMPSESSILMTPTCAIPLTPPPGRTSATLPALVAGHANGTCDSARHPQIGDISAMAPNARTRRRSMTPLVINARMPTVLFALPSSPFPFPLPTAASSRLPGRAVNIPESRHRQHPHAEILVAHPLVGRVGVLARKSEPHEENWRAEYALEIADDGDGAAFAGDHGLLTERRAQRTPRCVVDRPIQLGAPRASAVQCRDGRFHPLRRDFRDVRLHQLLDLGRILIGNET